MNGMNADSLQSDALAEPCAEDAWTVFTPFANNLGILKLSYFLHKHQMKATKNSQAYTVGTHGCV